MITNKQIVDGAKDALFKAFKVWLDENRAEILRMTAEAVAARVRLPKRTEPERQPEPEPKSPPQRQFLTTAELAERWHFHQESIRRLVRQGELSSVRLGRQVRLPVEEVEQYEKQATFKRRF